MMSWARSARSLIIAGIFFLASSLLLFYFPRWIKNDRAILNLEGKWDFCASAEVDPKCEWKSVNVPMNDAAVQGRKVIGERLVFKRTIGSAELTAACRSQVCALILAEVGDSANVYWNGQLIKTHGQVSPLIKYRKHLPLRVDLPPDLIREANELRVETFSLKTVQLGVRGSPNAVYTHDVADSVERKLALYSVGLPIFGSFGCLLIGLFSILFATSWLRSGAPAGIIYRMIFLSLVSSAYLFSFSEVPREVATINVTGFAHFFLRLLFDYALYEFVLGFFSMRSDILHHVRYIYYICLFLFGALFCLSEISEVKSGFDVAHFLMRLDFALLILPPVLGIVSSGRRQGPACNEVMLVVFLAILPMTVNDILIFHGLIKSLYYVKFYPFLINGSLVYVLLETFKLHLERKISTEEKVRAAAELFKMSAQVAHDIRSPLSALNLATARLDDIPEDRRLIIRNAAARINDIANNLLQSGRKQGVFELNTDNTRGDSSQSGVASGTNFNQVQTSSHRDLKSTGSQTAASTANVGNSDYAGNTDNGHVTMLTSLVDSILSEKRTQFRERMGIEIHVDLQQSYGLFSSINRVEIERAISNIIDNAVEALGAGGGTVQVTLKDGVQAGHNDIVIRDTGKGILPALLPLLGKPGVTFGKGQTQSGGSGLGIYQTKQAVEAAGGNVHIESELGKGTTVILSLPKSKKPFWFIDKITLTADSVFISVDDDPSIHEVWQSRLKSVSSPGFPIHHVTFLSLSTFKSWLETTRLRNKAVFAIDHEFIGQNSNGLDAIIINDLARQAILVSSHVDEEDIQRRAMSVGLRLLPKSLAPLVPIEVTTESALTQHPVVAATQNA